MGIEFEIEVYRRIESLGKRIVIIEDHLQVMSDRDARFVKKLTKEIEKNNV